MRDDVSYIAGLVDGEGCITITSRGEGRYQLVFRVAMYDREPLDLILDTFGGSVDPANRKDKKPLWCYTATDDKALNIILSLTPYLIAKRNEAEIAIIFQGGITKYKGGRRKVPENEVEFRELCYQKMQVAIKSHKLY